ncbi:acetylcholinesterase [Plectosphaerella cucumerina]|uniref:Acetylcholinesterase n=1 Tax=Plectosphaerella cucumerina TaxID=40658 RepID=A0A8K0X1F9_9PEZI|nr:acetylcholinesterase [Plectosphaerella cucumerina]
MKLDVLPLLALGALARADKCPAGPLTVRTSTGTFTGLVDSEFPNVRQFLSIPFAEPPVASRRWLPPQKLSSSPDEHRYATKLPPSCPQFFPAVESMWNLPMTKGNLIYNGAQNDTSGLVGEATSEDCLHLAIWTPPVDEIPEEGLPVLFFMTGGGFSIGGVDLPWQIPTSWVERTRSHIVVSVNYRVNIFGFPNARGLKDDEQNLGILDQRAALEWVHDNIAAFGGDPARIMQWGRSAGGISADIHAYAYYEDPIAESYYIESGTAFSVVPTEEKTHYAFSYVAANVGCGSPCGEGCEDTDGKAELDCMRQVSMIQISNFIGKHTDAKKDPPLLFRLVPDEKTFFLNYTQRSEEGKIARRPAIISFTANEMASLVEVANITVGHGDQDAIDAGTIDFAICPGLNSTAYRNRLGDDAPVFRFQYAAEHPNLNIYDWLGSYHNSETPLVFGTYHLLDFIAPSTDFQVEMSESIQDHILAFAKDPYNGPQELGWEPMDTTAPNGGSLLRFGGSSGKILEYVDGIEVDGACLGLRKYDSFP